ncbi:MAG: hypothetical protein AAFZ18_08470 [Myxococcota bacterium]
MERVLSREALLAATDHEEIFGPDPDPRALKRAYARLLRSFRPDEDPEAFEHLRQLYEAAKDGRFVERVEASAKPPTETSTPADDREEAARALEAGEHVRLLELFAEHGFGWVDSAPELWEAAAEILLGPMLLRLSLEQRTEIELCLPYVHDALAEWSEHRLEFARAVEAAEADPEVDRRWLDALKEAWPLTPPDRAERWRQLGAALSPEEIYPESMRRAHPGLAFGLEAIAVSITGERRAQAEWLEGRGGQQRFVDLSNEIRKRYGSRPSSRSVIGTLVMFLIGAVIIGGISWLVSWFSPGFGAIFAVVVGVQVARELLFGEREEEARETSPRYVPGRWRKRRFPDLEDELREQALFPHEAIETLYVGGRDLKWLTPDHPLVTLQRERSILPSILTPEHVRRVRRRFEKAEAGR